MSFLVHHRQAIERLIVLIRGFRPLESLQSLTLVHRCCHLVVKDCFDAGAMPFKSLSSPSPTRRVVVVCCEWDLSLSSSSEKGFQLLFPLLYVSKHIGYRISRQAL
jgi:hypothetical protein